MPVDTDEQIGKSLGMSSVLDDQEGKTPGRERFAAGRLRFSGADLYCLLLAWRVVIQRSRPPTPPGRLDEKNNVWASWVSSGCRSANSVLSGGPAFSGGDQG